MTTDELQTKIIKLFKEKLNQKSELDLSYPLIPRISDNYMSNRVVVIGQETNTWFKSNKKNDYNCFVESSLDEVYQDALVNRYDAFAKNSIEKYGGKFWSFQRKLYQENIFSNNIIEKEKLNHCWINLFSMEACKNKTDNNGRPTKNRKLKEHILELQKNLLHELLKLLEPKIIIFLTGNSLDAIAISSLGLNKEDITKSKIIDLLNVELACKITTNKSSQFYKCHIVRLYHPTYFMARINTYKGLKEKLANHKIKKNNADFYTDEVIKYLKNI